MSSSTNRDVLQGILEDLGINFPRENERPQVVQNEEAHLNELQRVADLEAARARRAERRRRARLEADRQLVRLIRTNRMARSHMHPTLTELRSIVSDVLWVSQSWVTQDNRDDYELRVRRRTHKYDHAFRYPII